MILFVKPNLGILFIDEEEIRRGAVYIRHRRRKKPVDEEILWAVVSFVLGVGDGQT